MTLDQEVAFLVYSPVAPLALYTFVNNTPSLWTASMAMPLLEQIKAAAIMFRQECPNAEEIHVSPAAFALEKSFNDVLSNTQFGNYKPVKFID